jgi:hypothetical protein
MQFKLSKLQTVQNNDYNMAPGLLIYLFLNIPALKYIKVAQPICSSAN